MQKVIDEAAQIIGKELERSGPKLIKLAPKATEAMEKAGPKIWDILTKIASKVR